MPKYYCDYCKISLAHSSMSGRRQHNMGRKHIQAKIDYYQGRIKDLGVNPAFPSMPDISGFLPLDPQLAAVAALTKIQF